MLDSRRYPTVNPWYRPFAGPQRVVLSRAAALALFALPILLPAGSSSQGLRQHEDMRGVLSRRPLVPALRNTPVEVRFSPDGRTLLIQDSGSIFVVSVQPLKLTSFVSAEYVYPAQFSSDSQSFSVVGYGLKLDRGRLPDGSLIDQRVLPFQEPCLDAQLSPGADYFACLLPDLTLVVYQVSSNEKIFSVLLAPDPTPIPLFFDLLPYNSAFPGPFGYLVLNSLNPIAGKGTGFLPMSFTADSKTLVVSYGSGAFRFDLAAHRKSSLPGSIHKHMRRSFCLLPEDRILLASTEDESETTISSLQNGEVLSRLSIPSHARVRLASNPRYAIFSQPRLPGESIYDLHENRSVAAPENLALDIFENEMAVLNDHGTLFLYHVGEPLPFISLDLPLDPLPVLSAAAVSPALDYLAIAEKGSGAVFQTSTGARVYSSPYFLAANLTAPSTALLLYPPVQPDPYQITQLSLPTGKTSTAWTGGKQLLVSSGTADLEYSLVNSLHLVIRASKPFEPSFTLVARDPASGSELWKQDYRDSSPIPFADPQGDRVVLAWRADSPAAHAAAKHIPSVWPVYKKSKLSDRDTFFEVLDARSGQTIGGVLYQRGDGPQSVDAAYSVGDALFLVKDGRRISVLSLRDGSARAVFLGGYPVANAQSKLFAAEESPGHVSFFDLETGKKLGEHVFPHPISYMHFSADGTRLLVLTAYQIVYILDTDYFRQSPATSTAALP